MVIYLPRAHPSGSDNNVPVSQIVRWCWHYSDSCSEVVLSNGERVLTSLRADEIKRLYEQAMKGTA